MKQNGFRIKTPYGTARKEIAEKLHVSLPFICLSLMFKQWNLTARLIRHEAMNNYLSILYKTIEV